MLNLKEKIKALEIVHVINRRLTIKDFREIKQKLQKTRKTFSEEGLDAEFHLYAGKIEEEIIKAAQDYEGTTIAMGVSTKKTLQEVFLGNPSSSIAEKAPIAVLMVPGLVRG